MRGLCGTTYQEGVKLPRYIVMDDCYRCAECCALPGHCDCPDPFEEKRAVKRDEKSTHVEHSAAVVDDPYAGMYEYYRPPAPGSQEFFDTYNVWGPPGFRPY